MSYLNFFSALTDTIVTFATNGGYAALFLVIFFEAIPLLGMTIPGHVSILGAGFLVATGTLDPVLVVVVSIIGATLGDYISFLLGKRFGWPLIERFRRYFFVSAAVVEKARKLIDTHSKKALLLGRFNPVTRGLMPFFVGANNVPTAFFWKWNAVGALVWIVSSVLAGYFVGIGYAFAAEWVGKAVLIAILMGILIIWGYRFVNVRFHIFKRYELFMLGLNIISLLVLMRVVDDALKLEPFLAGFDLWVNGVVNQWILNPGSGILVEAASWLDALGGTIMIPIYMVIAAMVFTHFKRWRSVVILLLSLGSTVFIAGTAKEMFMRIRPENFITPNESNALGFLFDGQAIFGDPSFPSAHAAFAATFFISLAYLLAPKIKNWIKRELFIVLMVLLPILIGLSRLVLSVHWATDVIAGWALGVFCATSSILFTRYVGAMLAGKLQEAVQNSDVKA